MYFQFGPSLYACVHHPCFSLSLMENSFLNSGRSGITGMESMHSEVERRHLQQQQQQQQQQLDVEIGHRGLHSVSGSGSVTVPHVPGEVC
jgi:transcription initiation factor TFIID subunit TAF12